MPGVGADFTEHVLLVACSETHDRDTRSGPWCGLGQKTHLPGQVTLEQSRVRLEKTFSVERILGASLGVQWLRIHLPMQGTWVRALVQEDPTCLGATKPVRHNY